MTAGTVETASRASGEVDSGAILRIVQKHAGVPGALLAVLEDIQTGYGYLPGDALRVVAEGMGVSLVDVYGVATFYRAFSLQPRGKHVVCVCQGTACHVRGAQRVIEEFQRQLGIRPGETTPDREFTLETVNCLGVCALGPMAVVDGHYFSNVRAIRVEQLIAEARAGLYGAEKGEDGVLFPIEVSCPHCGNSLMDSAHPVEGHPSIRLAASFGGKRCSLRWSSLYGSRTVESDHDIPAGAAVNLLCPHCRGDIAGNTICPECGGTMARTLVNGGGALDICSRGRCTERVLEVNGLSS